MWITIITINNIFDPSTNIFFINKMITMSDFDQTSKIGIGLLWRSIDSEISHYISTSFLWLIVVVELVIDFLMWRAFFKLLKITYRKKKLIMTA